MKKILLGVLVAYGCAGLAVAGDAAAGKARSAQCAACHGPDGKSTNPAVPSLAGKPEAFIVEQIKAFQAGKRINPLMTPVAKGLSDGDAANVGAYFSTVK